MKTIQEINKMIVEREKAAEDLEGREKALLEIADLRFVRLYLETNPSPDFVLSEKERLELEIAVIAERISEKARGDKKVMAQQSTAYDLPILRRSLRAIKFTIG